MLTLCKLSTHETCIHASQISPLLLRCMYVYPGIPAGFSALIDP